MARKSCRYRKEIEITDILDTVVISETEQEEIIPSTSAPQFSDLFDVGPSKVSAEPQTDGATMANGDTNLDGSLKKSETGTHTNNEKLLHEADTQIHIQHTFNEHLTSDIHSGTPGDDVTPQLAFGSPQQKSQNTFADSSQTETVQVEQISMEVRSSQPLSAPMDPVDLASVREVQSSVSADHQAPPDFVEESSGPDFSSLLQPLDHEHQAEDEEFDFDLPPVQTSTPADVKQVQPVISSQTKPPTQALHHVTEKTPPEVSLKKEVDQSHAIVEIKKQETVNEKEEVSIELAETAATTSETRQAVDEWENVQTITPALQHENSESAKSSLPVSPFVNYTDLYQHACQYDLAQFRGDIHLSVQRTGFKAIKHALFGPPKLHKDLQPEREQVFCLAHYKFDNQDSLHPLTLQTIFKKLTGAKFDCPRHGSHWEQIGFQGSDPTTDLRGCGMLGLLQLLYSVTTPQYLPLTREIYNLSLHDLQNFPFCVAGINMTKMVIQTLREDYLNKECNKRRGQTEPVMSVLNQMYMAAFYEFYTVWKLQHKTIADTGFVFKDLEQRMKKHPNVLLTQLEERLKQQPGGATAEVPGEPPIKFSKMET